MKYFLLMFLLISSVCVASEQKYGFQDIPFGTDFETTNSKMMEKFPRVVGYVYGDFEKHYNDYNSEEGDSLYFGKIRIGETYFSSIYMEFNEEENFYKYQLTGPPFTADYFNTELLENASDIMKGFIGKYGKATKRHNVRFMDVETDRISPLAVWKHKSLNITIGLTRHDFQYYAVALVEDKDMAKKYDKFIKDSEKANHKQLGNNL